MDTEAGTVEDPLLHDPLPLSRGIAREDTRPGGKRTLKAPGLQSGERLRDRGKPTTRFETRAKLVLEARKPN